MTTQIQIRRDTAANWNLFDPILAEGEPGLELDTGKIKYGDGTTAWALLPYAVGTSTDLTGYATETFVTGAIANINIPDLTGYATETYVTDAISNISIPSTDWANISGKPQFFDGNYNSLTNTPVIPDLTGYATETYVTDAIANVNTGNPFDQTLNTSDSVSFTGITLGGSIESTNGSEIYTLNSGYLDLYTDWGNGGVEVWLQHNDKVSIATSDGQYQWSFDNTGNLRFPDNTVQTTAFDPSNWASTSYVNDQTTWANITGKPSFFSGSYLDLTNTPTIPSLDGYATELYVDNTLGQAIGDLVNSAPAALDTLKEIADELGNNQSVTSALVNQLANKANLSDIPDVSSFATTSYVDDKTTWANISGRPTIPTQVSQLTNDSGYITVADLPVIPANLSDFNNDTGFITSSSLPTDIANLTDNTGLLGQGGNPFNQNLNTTNEPTFATVTTGSINYKTAAQIYENNSDRPNHTNLIVKADSNVIIQTDLGGNAWTFGFDGALAFPSGAGFTRGDNYQIKVDDGVTQTLDFRDSTGRGFYTNTDGFSLRGNGSNTWKFGTDGNLTFPDNTVQTTAYLGAPDLSGYVTGTPWQNEGYITSSALTGYALSTDIPTDINQLSDNSNLLGQGGGNPFDQTLNQQDSVLFNQVSFPQNNSLVGLPIINQTSSGTKLLLWPEAGNNLGHSDYAIGIADSTLWLGVPSTNQKVSFYGGDVEMASISGTGLAVDNIQSSNINFNGSMEVVTQAGSNGDIDLYTNGWSGNGVEVYLLHNDKVQITTDNGTYAWNFTNTGEFQLPNNVKQISPGYVQCQPNMDTVIYTGSSSSQATFKILLKVEGVEILGDFPETQSCEMMVAKSINNKVAGSVYGLVYTSINPLATFTTRWNTNLNRVEVLCRPNSTTDTVSVRSFVTEIDTSVV